MKTNHGINYYHPRIPQIYGLTKNRKAGDIQMRSIISSTGGAPPWTREKYNKNFNSSPWMFKIQAIWSKN